MSITKYSTRFWIGDKYLEAWFVVDDSISPPFLEITEVVEVSEKGHQYDKQVDFDSVDYPFKNRIEDYCWMEYDMCMDNDEDVEICSSCGSPCQGAWHNYGLGHVEAWGHVMVDRDYRYVSDCCDAPLPPPEDSVDDNFSEPLEPYSWEDY